MKIKIICIGKTTEPYLQKGLYQYRDRLKHYTRVEWVELAMRQQTKEQSREQIMAKEAELVRAQLATGSYLILLDEKGKQLTSPQLATFLNQRMVSGLRELAIAVGGAFGFDESLKQEAGQLLSLSRLTFTHQMARLILAEQLYRAMTILRNEPYHHG